MNNEGNWKYISENTIEYISLHDCECSHIYYKKNKLVLELVWMDVTEEHPQNPFSEAHESGNAIIELLNPQVVKGNYFVNGGNEVVLDDISQIDFKNIIVLNFDETKSSTIYKNHMFFIVDGNNANDNADFEISYTSSIVKFNEFKKESWFVNWGNRFHYLQESEELEKDFSEVLGKLKNKELPKKEEDDLYKIIKTIIARKDESSKICIKVRNEIMPELKL